MMDSEGEYPLDISEFECTALGRSRVVVVFAQTKRRYTYFWHQGRLDLRTPEIEGEATPHAVEVIDCLARAVAHKAVQDATAGNKPLPEAAQRKPGSLFRGLLHML